MALSIYYYYLPILFRVKTHKNLKCVFNSILLINNKVRGPF